MQDLFWALHCETIVPIVVLEASVSTTKGKAGLG